MTNWETLKAYFGGYKLGHGGTLRSAMETLERGEQILFQCSRCGELKPFEAFPRRSDRGRGRESHCSECDTARKTTPEARARLRAWDAERRKDPEVVERRRAARRRYKERHREKINQKRWLDRHRKKLEASRSRLAGKSEAAG